MHYGMNNWDATFFTVSIIKISKLIQIVYQHSNFNITWSFSYNFYYPNRSYYLRMSFEIKMFVILLKIFVIKSRKAVFYLKKEKREDFQEQDQKNLDLWPRESPIKSIFCHKRPQKAHEIPLKDHIRSLEAMLGSIRPHMPQWFSHFMFNWEQFSMRTFFVPFGSFLTASNAQRS